MGKFLYILNAELNKNRPVEVIDGFTEDLGWELGEPKEPGTE